MRFTTTLGAALKTAAAAAVLGLAILGQPGPAAAQGLTGGTRGLAQAVSLSSAAASAVTLQASAPTVDYGQEYNERLTATVTSPAGGTPTGTVAVTGGTVAACTITLAKGTGSCWLTGAALPVGTDQLTATYSGDANYAAATSTATITVLKAPATLTFFATPTLTYGNEQAATFTAEVASQTPDTPTGTVTVTDGTLTVCTITLADVMGNGVASGSCTPAATALPVGFAVLTAIYNGDADHAAGAGQSTTVAIGPAPTVTYSGTIRLYKMGYCLDDRNNSSSNGAVVQIWRCNGLANQRWQVMSDGTIRHNGLCLDLSGDYSSNGTKVQLWACNPTDLESQIWDTKGYRISVYAGTYAVKVLDDTGYGGNGTRQQIWTNNGTRNQLWETY